MKYAVIKISGKQYKVSEGDTIVVDKLTAKEKEKIVIEEILLLENDNKVVIGSPLLKNVKVEGLVLNQFKDKKIRVAKFRAKSRYRRVQGHRQLKTKLKIIKITAPVDVKRSS